jgi:hypothetical protein
MRAFFVIGTGMLLVGCTPDVSGTGVGGSTSSASATTATGTGTTTGSTSSSSSGGCSSEVPSAHLTTSDSLFPLTAGDAHVLYVGGDATSVRAFDTCTMASTPLATTTLGAGESIRGIARLPTGLAVAHTSPASVAVVSFLDPTSLSETGMVAIPSSAGALWDWTDDGVSMIQTTAGAGGVLFRSWSPTQTCQVGLGLGTSALGRGVALWGTVVVAAVHDSPNRVAKIPACTSGCTCGTPTFLDALPAGFDTWGIAVNGNKAYVVGISGLSLTTGSAGLHRFDLPSGVLEASYTWDPSQQIDGFTAVTILGNQVVVAGIQGGTFDTPMNQVVLLTGTATALSFPLDFGSASPPTQTATLFDGAPWRVVGDGKSVYFAGVGLGSPASGHVVKCTGSLACN